jgi:hypothetical protein
MDEKLPLVFNKPSKDESIKFQYKELYIAMVRILIE